MSFSTGKISMAKASAERVEKAQVAKDLANSLTYTFLKFAGITCAIVASGCIKSCKYVLKDVGVDRWLSFQFLENKFLAKVR
jgi:hypothetical protein